MVYAESSTLYMYCTFLLCIIVSLDCFPYNNRVACTTIRSNLKNLVKVNEHILPLLTNKTLRTIRFELVLR